MRETVRSEINRLPAKYRAVLVLRHLQELSYEEMASIMRVPVGTVKTQLFRARALLKQRLQDLERFRDEGMARAEEVRTGIEAGLRGMLDYGKMRPGERGGPRMNCGQAQQDLQLYIDGRLDQRRFSLVEAHLDTCLDCQHSLVLYEIMQAALRRTLRAREGAGQSYRPDHGAHCTVRSGVKDCTPPSHSAGAGATPCWRRSLVPPARYSSS